MSANRLQNGGLNRLYVLSTCFTLYHLNIIYNLVCTVSYTVQCSVQCTLYNTVLSHKIFCVSFLCNYMSLRMLSLCPSLHKKDNYFLCKQQLIYCSCTCTPPPPPPPHHLQNSVFSQTFKLDWKFHTGATSSISMKELGTWAQL